MIIRDIQVGEIALPLARPFKTALRTVEHVDDIVVRVVADTGEMGYGEAPPPPSSPATPRAPLPVPSGSSSVPTSSAWMSRIWMAL